MRDPNCMLFVYGTLRRDAGRPVHRVLARSASWLGHGSVPGKLYDLGVYAGLVESEDPKDQVRGELYMVLDPDAILPVLDAYEGCGPEDPRPPLFERRRTVVSLDDGRTFPAMVYYCSHPLGGARRVYSGDWLEALGQKKSQGESPSPRL